MKEGDIVCWTFRYETKWGVFIKTLHGKQYMDLKSQILALSPEYLRPIAYWRIKKLKQ